MLTTTPHQEWKSVPTIPSPFSPVFQFHHITLANVFQRAKTRTHTHRTKGKKNITYWTHLKHASLHMSLMLRRPQKSLDICTLRFNYCTLCILEGHQPERLLRQNKLFIGKLLHIHMYVCMWTTNGRLRRKSWNDCWESLFRWRLPNSHGRLLLIWEDEAATLSSSSWRHLVGVCFYLPPPLAMRIRERRRMRICDWVTILVVWEFHPPCRTLGRLQKYVGCGDDSRSLTDCLSKGWQM